MICLVQIIHIHRLKRLAGIQGGLFRWPRAKIVRLKLSQNYMSADHSVAEEPNHAVCLKDLDLLIVRCLIPVNIGECCFRLLMNLYMCQFGIESSYRHRLTSFSPLNSST